MPMLKLRMSLTPVMVEPAGTALATSKCMMARFETNSRSVPQNIPDPMPFESSPSGLSYSVLSLSGVTVATCDCAVPARVAAMNACASLDIVIPFFMTRFLSVSRTPLSARFRVT